MANWMIYGANGYTGRLCAEHAVDGGARPVLAGRRADAVAALARALDCPHRAFGLSDPAEVDAALDGIALVLHCAGPFSATSRPMLDACLRTGAHYLDITGEIGVFEAILGRASEIAAAGVAAVPGVGFDVVPTDCLAARLAAALPSATHLELAFAGVGGGISRGTAKTMIEGLPFGGAARIDGRITPVPAAWKTRRVVLGGRERVVTSIGWGDVSTAFHSTGIPNVTTYTVLSRSATRWLRRSRYVSRLLALPIVQAFLKRRVDARVAGPTAAQRASGAAYVWGRVEDAGGGWAEGHVSTPEGYRFTALASLAAVESVLSGAVEPGAWTPSRSFGHDFVSVIEGVVVDPIRSGSRGSDGA